MADNFWRVVNSILAKHNFYSIYYREEASITRGTIVTKHRNIKPCLFCIDKYLLDDLFTDKLSLNFDRTMTIYDYLITNGINMMRVVPGGSYEEEDALIDELMEYFRTVKLEDVPPLKGK